MIRPEWQECIRRLVDDWPPVTPETYTQLVLLLAPTKPTDADTAPVVALRAPQAVATAA